MVNGDNADGLARQSSPAAAVTDVLVVGGGIMGLWAALHAARAGLRVTLAEAGTLAGGASGGLLGALMPHMPDRWNAKKQFQFDALLSLEPAVRALEAETGLSAGYRRSGRLIPLPKPHLAEIARGHEADATRHWATAERRFEWRLMAPDFAAGLLEGDAFAAGIVEESFAARVNPRGLTAVLAATLRQSGRVTILERTGLARLDPKGGLAWLSDGTVLHCGHILLAAGHRTSDLLEPLCGPFARPPVVPVKGQSALLAASLPANMPVVYLDGLYIVPHEGGRVAIGSTSENRFSDPFSTDEQLDRLIAAARALMPALRDAPVLKRWAGLRPKAIGRDPMVGWVPGLSRVGLLTGGFKVSFGIAHVVSARLVEAMLQGDGKTGLPESFSPENHLLLAR